MGKGRGRQQWAGAGAGGGLDWGGLSGPPLATAPPSTPGLPPISPRLQSVPLPAAAAAPSLSRHPAAPCSGPAWRPRLRPPQMVSVAWGEGSRGLRDLSASERRSGEIAVLEREGSGEGDVRSSHGRRPLQCIPWHPSGSLGHPLPVVSFLCETRGWKAAVPRERMLGPVAMATGWLVLHSGGSGREEMGLEGGSG